MSTPAEGASARRPPAPAQVCILTSPYFIPPLRTKLTETASTRTGNNSSMQPSSDDDSEEDDVYGGAKGRSFARKHRKQKQAASGTGTPQLGEVRFSTRQAAKVTNYNEEEDYGLSEEDTENVTPSNWVVEPTGPSVDIVLNHRLIEGAGECQTMSVSLGVELTHRSDDSNPTKKDYEYYVSYPTSSPCRANADNYTDQMARPVTLSCHMGTMGNTQELQRHPPC